MRALRGFNDLVLYAGQGPAAGLYTLSLGEGEDGMSSLWLTPETKGKLLSLTDEGFLKEGIKLVFYADQEWQQTDGSVPTLQYGKKIGPSTWRYRQWLDLPVDHPEYQKRTWQDKMSLWDSGDWEEMDVDLSHYSYQQRKDAVETFGYQLEHNLVAGGYHPTSGEWLLRSLQVKIKDHSLEESVQLMCECLFELNV